MNAKYAFIHALMAAECNVRLQFRFGNDRKIGMPLPPKHPYLLFRLASIKKKTSKQSKRMAHTQQQQQQQEQQRDQLKITFHYCLHRFALVICYFWSCLCRRSSYAWFAFSTDYICIFVLDLLLQFSWFVCVCVCVLGRIAHANGI